MTAPDARGENARATRFLFVASRLCLAAVLLMVPATVFAETGTAPATEPSTLASLGTYLESALSAHPQMRAADAGLAAARARAEALSRPLYNPELNLDGEVAQSNTYALGLSQTLDFTGKRGARRLSGKKQLEQAIAEHAALRQKLATDILAALADYRGKQAALALGRQRLELLKHSSAIADQLYRAGDIGILDRNLANLAFAEAVAATGRAELDQLQSRRALDIASRTPDLEPPTLPQEPPSPDGLRREFNALVQALPAVRAASARSDAVLAQVEVARSNGRADPTVGVRGGRADGGGEPAKPLVAVQLSIPLFVRNNYRAEQVAASAEADAARIEADGIYRQALARLTADTNQYRASFTAWERWREASADRLDNGVELLDKIWKAREMSTTDYIVQLKQLLDGRVAGEELKYHTWRAWAEWLDASGQWSDWLALDAAPGTPTPSATTP